MSRISIAMLLDLDAVPAAKAVQLGIFQNGLAQGSLALAQPCNFGARFGKFVRWIGRQRIGGQGAGMGHRILRLKGCDDFAAQCLSFGFQTRIILHLRQFAPRLWANGCNGPLLCLHRCGKTNPT